MGLSLAPSAWLDSYRTNLKAAVDSAARDGFQWLEPNAAGDDFDPAQFGASARRHFRRYMGGLGLRLNSLSLYYPGRGLAEAGQAERRLERLRNTLEFCLDLGVRQATVSLDGFSDEKTRDLAADLLKSVADDADRTGVQVAVLGGLDDPGDTLKALQALRCPALGMVLDTGRLPRPDGLRPGALPLAGLHLRDVRPLGEGFEEVALGNGRLNLNHWLDWLAQAEYQGRLTVRRTTLGTDVDALRNAREYVEATQRQRRG